MTQIIQHLSSDINSRIANILHSLDLSGSTRTFPDYGNVAEKHSIMKLATDGKNYKLLTQALIEELTNHSTAKGVSTIAQETLARNLRCCVRTVGTHLDIIEEDGFIVRKKRYNKTDIIVLVPIYYKSPDLHANIAEELNLTKSLHRDLNINHYVEYETLLTKTKKESPKPEKAPTQKTDSILLSEWEGKREVLEEALHQAICKEIPRDRQEDAIEIIKRLRAPLEAKKELIQDVGRSAKTSTFHNFKGFMVKRYKEMKDKIKATPTKIRDYFNEAAIDEQAFAMATEKLKEEGKTDPATWGIKTWTPEHLTQLDNFRMKHSMLRNRYLRELSSPSPAEQAVLENREPKSIPKSIAEWRYRE